MEKTNSTSGNGSAFLNKLGWFAGLNLAWFLLALLTAWLGWRSYRLTTSGEVVTGTVVLLLEDDGSFTADFSPVVEFAVGGETYSVQSQNNYRWWNRYIRFAVGNQVQMRYDPANPKSAEINSWWDLWNETIILGIFTAFAAVAVNAYLLFRWRRQRALQVPA